MSRSKYNDTNHKEYLLSSGESCSFLLTLKFVADKPQSFLSREIDENCRQTHVSSQDATTNLELRILSEHLQENEQQINRPTQEGEVAAYTTLDHSNVRENHVYDVSSR